MRGNTDAAAFTNSTLHIISYPQMVRLDSSPGPFEHHTLASLIIHDLFLTACSLLIPMGLVF